MTEADIQITTDAFNVVFTWFCIGIVTYWGFEMFALIFKMIRTPSDR